MVYDSLHHQMVLFGGEDSSSIALNETWVWNGTTWTQMNPVTRPPARLWHAMAFDSAHGVVVLFGGTATGVQPFSFFHDTWLWDGTNWTQANVQLNPSGRQAPAMTYDAAHGQVLLFGGYDGSTALADTWTWDGAQWAATQPAAVPGRRFAAMSFDPVHSQTVLFGGDDGTTNKNDTWTWNGTTWTQQTPPHSPSARGSQGQAYDSLRNLTVMFGGSGLGDTWTWNGSDWTQELPPANPPGRSYVNMAYDTQRSDMLLFGGRQGGTFTVLGDTWTLGLAYTESWMLFSGAASGGPSARFNASAAFAGVNAMVFGGSDGTNVLNETWFWSGTEWGILPPSNPPPARQNAALAYNPASGITLLFGGNSSVNGNSLMGDTWIFTGGNWSQPAAGVPPSPRDGHAMAYDPVHSNTVLFGGFTGSYANDTWLWSGTAWTHATPANSPPGRSLHSMVFDAARQQIVLFGGFANGTYLNDTWVWDGATWTQKTPAISPPARQDFSMVYDSVHGSVQIFGGLSAAGPLHDTWAWDGTNWTQLTPTVSPSNRYGAASAYLPAKGQFLVFGGTNGSSNFADTWIFGSPYVITTTLPTGFSQQPYSYTIVPAGGVGPYTFTQDGAPFGFGVLGLTLNSNTGAITGTDQVSPGQPPIRLGVAIRDAQGQNTDILFLLPTDSLLTLAPSPLPDATAGANYTVTLSAGGGIAPYTFSASGLPAGLSLNVNQIVGQCTAGSVNVTLMVTDSAQPAPSTASVGPLTMHCNAAPAITSASPLPRGIVNTAYSATLQISGGTAPIAWSLTPGNLPPGFSLNSSTGVLTGTPAAAGSSQFSATATDFWGATATKPFTVQFLDILTITSTSLPGGIAGAAYPGGVSLAVTGGTGGGTYTFSATGLPTGISIDSASGAISGNTSQTGLFTPTFKVTDQSAQTATKQLNLAISAGTGISITSPPLLPSGTSGQPYSFQLQWSGGVSPYTVTGSGLPGWLLLNSSTGRLTGTPPTGGTFSFSVTVTDSQPTPNSGSQTFKLPVDPPAITTLSPLPAATIGVAYSQGLAVSGGTPPYTWTAINSPAWLSLSSGGVLSGTPPAGTPQGVSFDVTVTDSLGALRNASFTLPVLPAPGLMFLTGSPLPHATVLAPYATVMQASGGNGVLTFSASGLPAWATLNSATGGLSGTPPGPGPVTFQITVADSLNQSLSQLFTLPVDSLLTIDTSSSLPPATVNAPYSQMLTASGGSGIYTWSAAGLPSWLALSPSGALSGTPTQAGPVSFQVTVKDTLNNSLGQTFTLPADAVLSIGTTSPLPPATLNFPYLATFAASGGGGVYQWAATGLPAGFNLSSGGVLTGTAQTGTPIGFSVTLTDSLDNSLIQSFTLPVNVTVTIGTASPLPPATVNIPYSTGFTASGGNPGYIWSASGLPPWLTLTAAGFLSGTPPSGSTAVSFQVTVTDSLSHGMTASFTLPVNASPVIVTKALPQATVNVPYSTPLGAAGGSGVYTWSATGLPNGLTLSAAGVLSGKVLQPGLYSFQVKVIDSQGLSSSASFTLLVSTALPLSFVTQSLAPCVAGVSCSSQIVASGGLPPYTFSVPANTFLNGLTLSSSGSISGVPISSGPINIPVAVTDQQQTIARTFTQTVFASLAITAAGLPSGTVGVAGYGVTVAATGGQAPYVWSVVSGSLPPGLTIDSQGGVIYGTPTSAGTYTFSLQVRDSLQASLPRQLSIVISAPAVPLTVAGPLQLPVGFAGAAYSQNLIASGGSGQYVWTLLNGSLPAGLTLSLTGAITGVPAAAQTANFTAKVTDSTGNSIAAAFSIRVIDPATVTQLAPSPLPDGAVGAPYNYGIQVAGGTPPYFWSITQGTVPPGLTFDATNGTFSGTPTLQGSYSFTLTVTDSRGGSSGGTANTIRIAGPNDFQITTAPGLPNGAIGQSYSTTLAASNGAPPYQWQLVSGNLPAGMALDAGGHLTGTPPTAGVASFIIRSVDSAGAVATGSFQLRIVNPNAPVITAPAPPHGSLGTPYQAAFSAAGGHPPYVWSISAGVLPPGLSLDPVSGIISGTPGQPGNFPFTLLVTDSAKFASTQDFVIQVNAATLRIAPSSAIPNATANALYSFGLAVSGGTAPYTWSLSAGSLPVGLSIDPSSGLVSGAPAQAGSYQFTISVADPYFEVGSQPYQLAVLSNTGLTIVTSSTPPATAGSVYAFALVASNGAPPLSWSVASGSLPPGIRLDSASGQLTGTPTTAGSFTFTVLVTDATKASVRASFTLVVNPQPLTIVTAVLPGGAAGTPYNQTLQTAGGNGAVTWSLTSGTLPPGILFNGSTGSISGTPTGVGAFSFTVQATDNAGAGPRQGFTLNIAGPPVPVVALSGLPATSSPGDQPVVNINVGSAYPLPILVTATLSIAPNPGNATDLMFSNGLRTIQFTVPANTPQSTLAFQAGTLPGTIQISLALSAAGVDVTPPSPPVVSTRIPAAVPQIRSVAVAPTSGGLQVTVVGLSTTLDMKTATFHFTAAAGATLQTTDISVDVSGPFAQWYQNPSSLATGSQFSLTVPFTIGGNTATIASVSVTLTNSLGASTRVTANIP